MNIYKFTLKEDYVTYYKRLKGVNFSCEWGSIVDGTITIKTNYSWDGITLAFDSMETYYASLAHDFLYQFKPVKKYVSDLIFYTQLNIDSFPFAFLYYLAVTVLGCPFYYWIPTTYGIKRFFRKIFK